LLISMVPFMINCSSLGKKMFQRPDVKIEKVTVESINYSGARILFFIKIDNPNKLGVRLSAIDYTFKLHNEQILSIALEKNINIKGRESTLVEIPVDISFLTLNSTIENIISLKNIDYQMDTRVLIDTSIGKIPFKLHKEDFITMPLIPELSVENVKVKEMNILSTSMIFYVKIKNNDKIQMDIDQFDYTLYMNDQEISAGKLEPDQVVIKENEITLPVPVNLKLMNLKESVMTMIQSGTIQYKLNINIYANSAYGKYKLPISKVGTAKIY